MQTNIETSAYVQGIRGLFHRPGTSAAFKQRLESGFGQRNFRSGVIDPTPVEFQQNTASPITQNSLFGMTPTIGPPFIFTPFGPGPPTVAPPGQPPGDPGDGWGGGPDGGDPPPPGPGGWVYITYPGGGGYWYTDPIDPGSSSSGSDSGSGLGSTSGSDSGSDSGSSSAAGSSSTESSASSSSGGGLGSDSGGGLTSQSGGFGGAFNATPDSNVTVSGTSSTLDSWNTPTVQTSSYDFDRTTGVLEILDDGTYLLGFSTTHMVTAGASTSQSQAWLEKNAGGVGTWTALRGTTIEHYDRQTDHGASSSGSIIVELEAGDEIRLRHRQTEGTNTISMKATGTSFWSVRTS